MSLGDLLKNSDKSKLYSQSLNLGDVFLKKFEGIEHPKFFIVAGLSQDRVFLCSVYINSDIHPSIIRRQNLLELQVPLRKQNNSFLNYDSFANCSNPIHMESTSLIEWVTDNSCKVIGSIFKEDLNTIKEALKNSGLLSVEEIKLYFWSS